MQYRSGTEEEVTEIMQLLEDITSYIEDFKQNAPVSKKKKEAEDKRKGEEMRKASMQTHASKFSFYVHLFRI